jgi:hypothetical protein
MMKLLLFHKQIQAPLHLGTHILKNMQKSYKELH